MKQTKTTWNILFAGLFALVLLVMFSATTEAAISLDSVQFDPAIVASGDEVDIIIQYHDDIIPIEEDRIGDPNFRFDVTLESDDDLTKKYVSIVDSEGDNVKGYVLSGEYYNKVFRVKVSQNAPAGNYQFKLTGQWYEGDKPLDYYRYVRFNMKVKKEGIILDMANIETVPSVVRPGDNFVKVVGSIENVGEKDAKSVEVSLVLPEGLESSYSNNNRIWVGRVNAGESKEVVSFIDVDENVTPGVQNLDYYFEFMDVDNNEYVKSRELPFLVKSRPYLEVVNVEGSGKAGSSSELFVTVKNTGTESAESVDVRVIKQNSQPFTIDVRTDYIGELEPGEEGLAIFEIGVNSDAAIKEHDFKLLLRSKGDTDEGDDNIYTYNRRAPFEVTGKSPNILLWVGLIGAVAAIAYFVLVHRKQGGKKR